MEFGYKYYIWLQLGRIKLFKNTFIQAIHFILFPALYLPTRLLIVGYPSNCLMTRKNKINASKALCIISLLLKIPFLKIEIISAAQGKLFYCEFLAKGS